MVKIPIGCFLPKTKVSLKVKKEVHRIVNQQLKEIEEIERTQKLNPIDYEILHQAKKYGKLVRDLVDELSECKK